MCRACAYHGRGDLEVSGCEPEQTEAQATGDLLRVGARMLLVVVGFLLLCTFGCASCIAFGPDRPASQRAPLHPPMR
jgi:hypothetical protein